MASIPIEVLIEAKDKASSVLKSFGAELGRAGDKFSSLKGDILITGGAMAAFGATALVMGKQLVDAASFMEQQEVAFNTLTGSAERGKKTMQDLISFAAKTPFEIPQIVEQSKRLLAMGTSAEDLIKTFTMLGNVASGVGMEKLPQLVLAFGQIQAKGRLMGTELRQLTEAGFNLADAMGITNQKLDELVTNGEVGFTDVANAFAKVTGEGGRFNNLMANMTNTTAGQLSNLNDNIFKLKASIGEALLPAVNQLITVITPLLTQFAEWAASHQNLIVIGMAVAVVIGVIGAAAVALVGTVTVLTSAISILGTVFSFVGTIITAVVGILGGPLTIAILAIIAIGAVLTLAWKNNWLGIRDIVGNVVKWFTDVAWPAIKSVFEFIKAGVVAVAQQWIDRFNAIKSAVESVVGAIRNVISAAQDLANRVKGGLKIPGFASGGVVPGPVGEPHMAMVHGGEQITPVGGGGRVGSGGGDLVLNVNVGVYAGSETEKRNIARELYEQLVRVAHSQNITVAEMMGA